MSEVNKPPSELKQSKSGKQRVLDVVESNFGWIVLLVIAYLILGHFGYVPTVQIKLWHILLAASVALGRYGLGKLITGLYGDRFSPDGQDFRLDSKAGVSGNINIPQGTFAEYTVRGEMDVTQKLTGDREWRIRGIDNENKVIVAAGTKSDEKYPADNVILAEEGDLSAVEQLENALLEDAEAGRVANLSKEVRMEQARQEVFKSVSKAMQEVNDSGELSESDIEEKAKKKTGEIIQQFAEGNGGDSDE